MDTDPRPDLTAAQRIAIALGTAEPPADDVLHGVPDTDPGVSLTAAAEPVVAGFVEEALPDSPA